MSPLPLSLSPYLPLAFSLSLPPSLLSFLSIRITHEDDAGLKAVEVERQRLPDAPPYQHKERQHLCLCAGVRAFSRACARARAYERKESRWLRSERERIPTKHAA